MSLAPRPSDHPLAPEAILHEHVAGGAGGVRKSVNSGVRWMGSAQVLTQLVRVGSMLVLTHLLTPRDFGLVALVTVITGFFERILGDTGTTAAIVRVPQLTQGLASSVFYWNVVVGSCSAVLLAVGARPLAGWLGDASAADLLRVLGLLAVINSLTYVPSGLLRRRTQFRLIALIALTNATVTGVASIGLAIAGTGTWALVFGNLIGSAVAAALSWVLVKWRPSRHFSRRTLSEISGFSTNLTVSNLFGYFSFAGDRFIIGRFIGATELGFYGLANRLLRYPVQTSAQTYREVVFPNLARVQSDHAAMTTVYQRSLSGIAFILFPICFLVAAIAEPLVSFALGDQWAPTTDILGLVAITAALQAVASTTGSLYNARGRADLALRWQLGSSVFLVASYAIGARWGLVGVAWGYLIGTALLLPLAFWIPLRLIGARVTVVTRGVMVSAITAGLAALVANGVVRLADAAGWSSFAQLALGGSAGALTYLAFVGIVRPQAAFDLRRVLARS